MVSKTPMGHVTGSVCLTPTSIHEASLTPPVMGKIPARSNMVSSIIVFPAPGQVLSSDATFNIRVQTRGLAAGAFTNAAKTYYSAPQDLDNGGNIIGHTHAVVQDLGGSFTPDQALDPTTFAFFKGINDKGDGNGLLSAKVDGGLPVGFYRVCTMSSAANHQPVLMPVAQRGPQDDCTKFEVRADNGRAGGGGGNNNRGGGGGTGGDTADPNSDGDESNDNNDSGDADTDNQNPDQVNGGDNNDVDQGGNSGNGGANSNGGDNDVATTTATADASETSASDDIGGDDNDADIPDETTSTESPAQETGTRGGGRGGRGRNRFNRLRTRTRDSPQATAAPEQTEAPDTNENVVVTTSPAEATETAAPVGDGGSDGEDDDNQDDSQDQGDAPTDPAESESTPTSPAAEDLAETSAPDVPAPDTQAPDVAEPVKSGDLGGEAPPIENSGDAKRPLCVGKDKFVNKAAAVQRSCDKQFNRCADAAVSGHLSGKTLQDCEAQRQRCGKQSRK